MAELAPRTLQEFSSTTVVDGPLSEEDRARKFRTFFGIGFLLSVDELYSRLQAILQASDIPLSHRSSLPSGLDGFHQNYDGTNQIVLNGTNSKQHEVSVLLHEIRGLMTIQETGRSERDDPSGAMDKSADMFALAVMNPPEMLPAILLAAVWDGVSRLPAWARLVLGVLAGMGLLACGAHRVAAEGGAISHHWKHDEFQANLCQRTM